MGDPEEVRRRGEGELGTERFIEKERVEIK
jgi:hypothetical protein